jgi:presenilin-like A22 family membrane protease
MMHGQKNINSECMFVALIIQHTKRMCCRLLYYHLWLASIFPHYLINGTIFGKNVLAIIFIFFTICLKHFQF